MEAITLGAATGLQAEVLTYGAILRQLSLPVQGQRRALVLHLQQLQQYEDDTAYMGAVVGRFANRIANGRFLLTSQVHQLACNENGNHLHGGAKGTGKHLWRIAETPSASRLKLALSSPAGDEGYPGQLDIGLELSIAGNALRIEFAACTDAPTPVNLTYHPYFNLGGDAGAHWLRIPASHYLPVRSGLIPTGEIAPVDGTPFDFRAGRAIAPPPLNTHPQLLLGGGYDHCWVLDADADCHCELRSAAGDLALRIAASGPGLQFYGGQFLSRAYPTLGSAVALEPQGLPDAPNHPGFPDAVLRPGQTYRASFEYRLNLMPPG